jgi:hypothetical protein
LLQVKLHDITQDLVNKLESLSLEYPGPCQLKLNVADIQENIEVELLSRKFQVKPQDELMAELDQLSEISYKILN